MRGKVYGVPLGDGNYHCFNVVGDCVFDLTSEQFGKEKLNYVNCPEQERSIHFARAEKKARYELLRNELMRRRPVLAPITIEHLKQYGEIYVKAFSGEPWHEPWKAEDAQVRMRERMEAKTAYGLEYAVDGRAAAFLLGTSMLLHFGRVFEIIDLAVDPDYQRRGIASILLERCKADMKEREIVGICLTTSGDSFLPDLYECHGFKRETELILMWMEL